MTTHEQFADHMVKVLAGILVEVANGINDSESTVESLTEIGTDAGLALVQATAYRKKLTEPCPAATRILDQAREDIAEGYRNINEVTSDDGVPDPMHPDTPPLQKGDYQCSCCLRWYKYGRAPKDACRCVNVRHEEGGYCPECRHCRDHCICEEDTP